MATAHVSALPNIPSLGMVFAMTILPFILVKSTPISVLYAVEWINLRPGQFRLQHFSRQFPIYIFCNSNESDLHLTSTV